MKNKTSSNSTGSDNIISLKQSLKSKEQLEKQISFKYKAYTELLQKRSSKQEKVKESLLSKVECFPFDNWWRLTIFQYSRDPLNTKGSYKNPHGGRFNIGNIEFSDTGKFLPFPALYLAQKKDTVIKEKYQTSTPCKLSSHEMMLQSKEQDLFIRVKGRVHILDIDRKNSLNSFVNIIKEIKFDPTTIAEAKRIKTDPRTTIQTVTQLKKALYDPDWRSSISIWDDPPPSQIFGQIVKSCGIEGILYSSPRDPISNHNKCLALFLQNFKDSDSFVEIIDSSINKKRIDQHTFQEFI